ncbi:predicted protein [Thalassiosira pseudonana CCMP1335]|uniref:Kinase n=1 Tax=Thalassiosira pseudonana TaxID=35128 RepID=B8LBV3_THAPS|nr:predicted protein [Thalassiosira pseudonana CCMP1335]EED87112.1 predicted protein [Thalassiosira pseudonana CCMP1335]
MASLICTSTISTPTSTARISSSQDTYSTLVASLTVATAAIALTASWRFMLWRGRVYAKRLHQDVAKADWKDGTPLIDCPNDKLHQSIVESARRRGTATLQSVPMFLSDQNESDIADSFYQSSSSGGVSADDGKSPYNVEAVGCNLTPTRMAEQVGGIAKHKHPSYVQSCCNHLEEMKSLGRLAVFTSPYYGLFDLNDSNGDTATQQPYLLLRDLTAPFDRPNVIDIKMGTQTYEPTAPLSKQHREFNKYPQQSDIGFRIVAMRMYSFGEDKYQYRDKSFGTSLQSRRDIVDALTMFFCGAFGTSLLLSRLIDELNEIKIWFEEQNASLAFYASSILIIYEGSPTNTLIDPSLKMIDFAHVCRKKGGDKGYLRGIENLICILSEIQSKG